jgi:hypothetical protein
MKFLLLFLIPLCLHAAPKAIRQFPLDEYCVVRLEVPFANGNSTVLFPSSIGGLYGAKITRDPGKPADFLLTYQPGSHYFQVRALQPKAKDTLTVIYNRKAYILQLEASETPVFTVTFYRDSDFRKGTRAAVDPARLLALVDKAKAYPVLSPVRPDAYETVEHVKPARIMRYKNFRVYLDEVFRFEADDTLVFRILLQNESLYPIRYDKELISVRLSDRIYSQSFVDASGEIPPGSLNAKGEIQPGAAVPAYFAITGTPNGGRNNLSADNRWNVLIPAYPRAEAVTTAAQ